MVDTKSKPSPSHHHSLREKKGKPETGSAYFKWLYRGASHGADIEDCLEAEQDMLKNAFERDPEK
jgi:hypothetical protein